MFDCDHHNLGSEVITFYKGSLWSNCHLLNLYPNWIVIDLVMSLKGVRQLKELIIRYSDYDGSSKGIREWMRVNLVDFAAKNPETSFKTLCKRNCHPYLQAQYLNGNSKTICVKNLDPKLISNYALFLRNQIGRKVSLCLIFRRISSELFSLEYL